MSENNEAIVIITYISIFNLDKDEKVKIVTYKEKDNHDKRIKAILTNEAGIQDIMDSLEPTKDLEQKIHIVYFATNQVVDKPENQKTLNISNTAEIDDIHKNISGNTISPEAYFKQMTKIHFENRFQTTLSDKNFHCIKVCQNQGEKSNETLSQELLQFISKIPLERKNIKIYVDTTGGYRDASYLYVMLSKILSYSGYDTKRFIYSKYNPKGDSEISNVNSTLDMLNIINGFHEFLSYGKVKTLRGCLKQECSEKVEVLLQRMEKYADDLALCRWKNFKRNMDNIKKSIDEIRNDTGQCLNDKDIMVMLLIDKVERSMALTENEAERLISALKNCIENEMYQQAITLYREKVPEVMEKTEKLVISIPDADKREKTEKPVISILDADKLESYLHLIENSSNQCDTAKYNYFARNVVMIENMEVYKSTEQIDFDKNKKSELQTVLKDYVRLRKIRNCINHGNADIFSLDGKDKSNRPIRPNKNQKQNIETYFNLISEAKSNLDKEYQDNINKVLQEALNIAISHLEALFQS